MRTVIELSYEDKKEVYKKLAMEWNNRSVDDLSAELEIPVRSLHRMVTALRKATGMNFRKQTARLSNVFEDAAFVEELKTIAKTF